MNFVYYLCIVRSLTVCVVYMYVNVVSYCSGEHFLCFEVCVAALLQVRLMPEQRKVSFSLLIVG